VIASLMLCTGCGASEPSVPMSPAPAPAPAPSEANAADDDAIAARYATLRAGFDEAPSTFGGAAGTPEFQAMSAELRTLGSRARDVHLQANLSLLLGAMHQERGQWAEAAGAYRRAATLVDDDAGPHMALAFALAQTKDFKAAAAAQAEAVRRDPDNLEQYLALGELLVRAEDKEGSAKAYADYETRRRGLIDGLTLKREGAYRIDANERIACAESLASAPDVGTAFALLYALQEEPEAKVRAAIVRAMGVHRLVGYKPRLVALAAKETDDEVKEAIAWTLAEIERAPVDTKLDGPVVAPQDPAAPAGAPPSGTAGGDAQPATATSATAGGSDRPAEGAPVPAREAAGDTAASASAP
jgi:tetratricopeptide (TPR) repeat protein